MLTFKCHSANGSVILSIKGESYQIIGMTQFCGHSFHCVCFI